MRIVLLPSPLLGGTSFRPLAAELEARDAEVLVATLPEPPIMPEDVLEAFTQATSRFDPHLVVAHSNAGLYAPSVSARTGGRPIVFMDAALPSGDGQTATAPARFSEFVSSLTVSDGLLPGWTDWWDPEAVQSLFPNDAWRRLVTDSQPRLSPTYFDEFIDVPARWSTEPAAYLAFGDTYAEELVFAARHGWPTTVLDGHHLHHLWEPAMVASAVKDLHAMIS